MVETLRMRRRLALSRVPAVQVPTALNLESTTRVSQILPAMTPVHTTAVLPGIMPHPTVYSLASQQQTAPKTLVASHTQPVTRMKLSCAALVSRMLLHAHDLVR